MGANQGKNKENSSPGRGNSMCRGPVAGESRTLSRKWSASLWPEGTQEGREE